MTLSLTRRQRKALGKLGAILINLPFVFLIMIPLLYTFMMSVMPADELYSRFWPSHADFSSYLSVFTKTMIPRHILNSFIVAGSVTILQMITCSMAAFSFSFLEFRGRNFVFMCILATMMVPWEATIIANYLTVSTWGWLDSYRVLILPYGCSAMGVFLMRQNYLTFAKELHEAAKLDGCSNWRFLATIVIPLGASRAGRAGRVCVPAAMEPVPLAPAGNQLRPRAHGADWRIADVRYRFGIHCADDERRYRGADTLAFHLCVHAKAAHQRPDGRRGQGLIFPSIRASGTGRSI